MAIDPDKLSALVEEQAVNPLGDLPMPEDSEEEETEGTDDLAERGEELLTSMGEFGNELRESADILLDNAEELGEDVGTESAPESVELAADMGERLPPFLQEGMVEHILDKPPEDLKAVGAALDATMETEASPEGAYTEEVASQVGGMLEMVAQCCAEDAPTAEEEDEDDEDEGAEDAEAPAEENLDY